MKGSICLCTSKSYEAQTGACSKDSKRLFLVSSLPGWETGELMLKDLALR